MRRARPWTVIVVTLLAVLTPLNPSWRGREKDSFPLSWYPMFSKERPEFETPTYAVGVKEDGSRVRLDVSLWTTGGFNQGREMLAEAVRSGVDARTRFCERVAHAAGRKRRGVVEVRLVKGTYDRRAFFLEGDQVPLRERVLARCPVTR